AKNLQSDILIVHNGKNSPTTIRVTGQAIEPAAVAPPPPVVVNTPPAPPKVLYVIPPQPSQGLDAALRLQQARKSAGMGDAVVQTDEAFMPLTLYNEAPHYGYLGIPTTLSSYPVTRSRLITADRYIPAV